ncbi:MAG: hypothetical protein JJE40_10085 [Vicinamibacteria bacterium]|nr:hypothetical protein [Vicinamibacteria bacterium]
MLALHAAGERVTPDPLAEWPRRDGWFLDRSSGAVNVGFNALAAIVLAALARNTPAVHALTAALVSARGMKLPQSPGFVQNNALQGWPWIDGTFSWVEPTALAVIALKRLRSMSEAQARVAEGQRLLLDRVCRVGGWNYGNANALGSQLEPQTPPTALALMALRDHADTDAVRRSRQYLSTHRLDEWSGLALGLTRVALGVFDEPAPELADAIDQEWRRSAFLGNLHVTALALYAEAAAAGGYEAFRV